MFVDMGDTAIGVQIVADGDGRFTAVGFQGGLPGDGWDRAPRQSGKGTLNNGAIEFKGQGYSSTVKDGVMTIGVAGVEIGKLKKQDRESASFGAKHRRRVRLCCSTARTPTSSKTGRWMRTIC